MDFKMESSKQSQVITVELPKSGAAPAIKQRLESEEKKPALTISQINDKLNKASESRAKVIESQKATATHNIEKVMITKNRKSSVERMFEEQQAEQLQEKMTHASQNHQKHVEQI